MPEISFPVEKVRKKLQDLKVDKSSGVDGISPHLLKQLADELAHPLSMLFTLSHREGFLPKDWKNAVVVPIFKKGSKNVASNYRPVSLTCILCKIMESFIREAVLDHAISKNYLCTQQFT